MNKQTEAYSQTTTQKQTNSRLASSCLSSETTPLPASGAAIGLATKSSLLAPHIGHENPRTLCTASKSGNAGASHRKDPLSETAKVLRETQLGFGGARAGGMSGNSAMASDGRRGCGRARHCKALADSPGSAYFMAFLRSQCSRESVAGCPGRQLRGSRCRAPGLLSTPGVHFTP